MSGMNINTGQPLATLEHIRQSIVDILTTPIGSRVMRRDYGSLLFELIDSPITPAQPLKIYAASFMAIQRWEPRVKVTAFSLTRNGNPESLQLNIELDRLDTPAPARASLSISIGKAI